MSEQDFELETPEEVEAPEAEQPSFDDELEQAFTAEPVEETTEFPEPEVPIVRVGDREIPEEELTPYMNFADWVNQDPSRWNQLQAWERGELQLAPPAPVAEPEFAPQPLGDIDPYSEEYLRGVGEQVNQMRAELERRSYVEAAGAVDEGIDTFASRHAELTPQEMDQIVSWAADRSVLSTIPDSLPYPAKAKAVAERFEEGYRVLFFDRAKQEGSREVARDMAKRRKASSSSSPHSGARVAPEPSNPLERRQAYVDDIAQALAEGSN